MFRYDFSNVDANALNNMEQVLGTFKHMAAYYLFVQFVDCIILHSDWELLGGNWMYSSRKTGQQKVKDTEMKAIKI